MALSYFCSYCGAESAADELLCRACQHPLTDGEHELQAAHTLHERYEVLTEVGSGGFGAVYKARDTHERGRVVAIKQINLKGLSSQEVIEATDAFNREAELLSALNHPLLPHVFDLFHDPEHWYLVLTFIEGQTLDDYLRDYAIKALPTRTGLSLAEVLEIGLQLCNVLHYLHTREPAVIFRDLKPGNIMRTTSGELFLIDFGIARRFKPGQAKDTLPFGSPGFASPEQYGRAQTTPRADIYSLGALLYYLLSDDDPSEHPFQFPELRIQKVAGLTEMETLLQRMVALDPAQRPSDMQEIQQALQEIKRISNQTPTGAIWLPPTGQTPAPPGAPQQAIFFPSTPRGYVTRRNLLTGGISVGILAACGVGAVALLRGMHTQTSMANLDATALAQTNSLAAVPPAGITYWSPDLSHAAVIPLSEAQIDLYRVQGKQLLGSIKPTPTLSEDDLSHALIQWSPDNNSFAVIPETDDNTPASIWDARSLQLRFTLPSGPTIFPALFWSPNGKFLAVEYTINDDSGDSYAKLVLLQANNGKRLFEQQLSADATANIAQLNGNTPIGALAWSPDSRYLLVPNISFAEVSANGSWSATLWQIGSFQPSGTLTLPLPWSIGQTLKTDAALYISWSPDGTSIAIYFGQRIWICSRSKVKSTYNLGDTFYDALNCGPIWSPNGIYLAMLLDGNLAVCHAFTGQHVLWTLDGQATQGDLVSCAWTPDSRSITVVDANNVISTHSVG